MILFTAMDFISAIGTFLNSNFFTSSVTVVAGLVALAVYLKQKSDTKKDAANIVLLEIQSAERELRRAREIVVDEAGNLPENTFAMPTQSWDKYKYLFVRDFNRNDWDSITDFYNKCRQYDECVEYSNSFFQKNEEQVRVNIQRGISHIAKKYSEDNQPFEAINAEYEGKVQAFLDRYMHKQGNWMYRPQKPLLEAKTLLSGITLNLSQTSVGLKFGALARIKT